MAKEKQRGEVNSHAFKELHTQARVLAAKHPLVHSLVEACVLGQVLINTTELRTVQQHCRLPLIHAGLGPGMGVAEIEANKPPSLP